MTRRKTHEEYLEELEAKGIDIKPVERYKGARDKILHRCIEGHEWKIRPSSVLYGTKCPKCFYKRISKTHEEYLEELFEKEIDCEPIEPYAGAHTKILHRCIEGHEWLAKPNLILSYSGGCPFCYEKSHENYLEELRTKKINYEPLENYINNYTKILHRCIKGHEWKITPKNVLHGKGCPECAKYGFSPDKPAILYYLRVDDYYKVGITNNTVEKRYRSQKDREKITVLFEKYYERGQDARDQEKVILEEFADYRIHVPGLLQRGGNTELFTEDVLQLDKKGP